MEIEFVAVLYAVCLFIGMLFCAEIGRRLGIAHAARDAEGLPRGAGAAEAAVFALLGLLIAFTFSGAASRFEDRRHLVTAEANAIGTAYLRVDLLSADARPELKALFRRYADARIATYSNVKDDSFTKAKLAEVAALQQEIWTKALEAGGAPGTPVYVTTLLVPALNEMIDITTTRFMATRNHPPLVVFLMLGALSLVGALLVGYDTSPNKDRTWLHNVVFAGMMSLALYVIIDLEFPRLGLIRVDAADEVLVDLRRSMR